MKPEDVVPVMELIMDLFPRFELRGASQVESWAEALGGMKQDEALSAVRAISRTSEWPPTVRDLRAHVAANRGLLAPDTTEAQPQMKAWLFYIDQGAYVNLSGYKPDRPRVHRSIRESWQRMGNNWEEGFRFEWPKIKAEYDNKILEGDS